MTQKPSTRPAAIYVRLSKDDGSSTALLRQEKESRALADKLGLNVVRVYSDNDLSAFKGKSRPAFTEMITDVKSGSYETVIAWKLDRITRNGRAWIDFKEALEESDTHFITVTDGIDSKSGAFGIISAVLTEMAAGESKSSSIRLKAKHRELREQGKPSGGGKRPFGHTQDWKKIVPAEAKVLQEAATRVLAGEAVNAVVKDFNKRGITTVNGSQWVYGNLRDMLRSYRLAGAREVDGNPIATGQIAEILTLETVERLRALLTKRGTGVNSDARYLLSGKAVCGRCSSRLTHKRDNDGRRRYQCVSCNRLVVGAENVEDHVTKVLIAALNNTDWNEATKGNAIAERVAILSQLESDQASLAALTNDFYVDKVISREQFFSAQNPLQTRIRASEAELAATATSTVIDDLIGTTLEAFSGLDVGRQRGIIASVIDKVTIAPVSIKSGPRFQPERISIAWKA